METKELVPMQQLTLAQKLNESVFSVIKADALIGFEKAYLIANAAAELKKLLTPEYMKPIMALQGNKLGFKTDKDSVGGYPESVVKDCLIEAVLTGVQPFGNQFNIIAGNCYITKEGFGYLLNNFSGLDKEIIPELPRINGDSTSAAIKMKIWWKLGGVEKSRELDIPIRMNKMMGTDAVIGKATRKARAWLFNTINGTEIADGDIMDLDAKVVIAPAITANSKEQQRVLKHIQASETPEQLMEVKDHLGEDMLLTEAYAEKLGGFEI